MKIVLIILVVLLIVAAIAFVVFKKIQLQRDDHDSISGGSGVNPIDRLRNLNSNAHDDFNEQHGLPQQPATNPLAIAESHLSNQNYPEAISALKNVLMTNPRHQGAMIKLLQTYGVTKQYDAFNQLHQKIHEVGDGETIREADFCKSLLDEEIQTQRHVQTPSATQAPTSIDSLNFDSPAPAPTASLDSLDFDIEPKAPAPVASQDTEELLDLDFNTSTNQAPTANNNEILEFDGFDFDPTPAPAEPVKAQADDLSFGLDADFGFEEPKVESKPAPAPQADDSFDLDTGFDFDPTPKSEPVKAQADSLDLDAGFDFDPTPAPAEPVKAQADDLSFGLDADFGFEEPKVESKPAPAPQADDSFDLDTGFDFDPTPKSEPVKAQADDLSFGLDMPLAQATQEPVAVDTFQADDSFSATSQEIPSEIGFVSTLDNSQITLDLAKQYLEFGEYESAKHLLNEVAKTGSDAQRQDAIELIRRLG